ncbi:MAG: hypothetical protein PWQ85_606 [Geotoga sp.]|nr:hypothetical protein [Geotoga sp.]
MEFLKKELEMYKKFLGNIKLDINSLKKTDGSQLNLGDIFVIYTENLPIYGIVTEKNGNLNQCLHLTPELFLASPEAIRININHIANEIALTHIVFYIFDDFAKSYCEVIGTYEDIETIKRNFEILNKELYIGPREEFFNLEIEKLFPLYDLFFVKIEEEISEGEKIIKINIPEYMRKPSKSELLAAETKGIRGNNYVGLIKEKSLLIYPKDELIGKKGLVRYERNVIYKGVIPEILIIENIEGLVIQKLEKELQLEVI